jgi:hypothetical protein
VIISKLSWYRVLISSKVYNKDNYRIRCNIIINNKINNIKAFLISSNLNRNQIIHNKFKINYPRF